MINYELFEYQTQAMNELMDFCIKEPKSDEHIVLQAPTGSGKTIILSAFIDEYLDNFPNTVVFWLSPGKGGLEEQSRKSFDNAITGRKSGDVYDFLSVGTHEGKIFFINWEMITGKNNRVLREAEWKNLYEKVRECHDVGNNFLLIVDEEHSHDTDKAKHVITQLLPVQEIRASATANTKKTNKKVEIKDSEVIASGMIAEAISVNQDLPEELTRSEIAELVSLGDSMRKRVRQEYENIKVDINPLVLIQFPNGQPETIEEVEKHLLELGYSVDNGTVARWFSGDRTVDVESLKDFDNDVRFLLFKQAIATGWDCPRAKILVKLREGGDETFNIQTIGRIRRMPERKHYENEILDKCYLYTRDAKFETGLKNALTGTSYNERTFKSKENDLELTKYFVEDTQILVNELEVFNIIKGMFLAELDDDKDGELSQKELLRHGYSFSEDLDTPLYQGLVHTLDELGTMKATKTSSRQVNTHIDGYVFKQVIRDIGVHSGLSENAVKIVLKNLFSELPPNELFPELQSRYEEALKQRIYVFKNSKSYYAFVINNREKLIDVFSRANAAEQIDYKGKESIQSSQWRIPERQLYRYDAGDAQASIVGTNIFLDYNTSMFAKGLHSSGEELFENWCEHNPNIVEYYYRNGDKGGIYFSLTYHTKFQIRNFYPDYILKLKNGEIWIIEVKGGMKSDGESGNTDAYASHKFKGLLNYQLTHSDVKVAMARPYGGSLRLSTREWIEDIKNEVWEPIEKVLK
ncbi:DEAD/DEAH box helicase family protein [Erysipelothrix rhusiopathiae]|uniref:DEAD/DEAH box helicase family protein n=1 Tax=Erysipelothrix rhusiopathiae TaxID=1648 RepID=UPI0024814910|nr:DEAD/DEAH box helicase family protein [Erysipelothrix rhusiopathiae]